MFKFKAWNKEARLLMKLSSIDFRKGELYKKDHVLLQFTGMLDENEEEIYEMDILMVIDQKYLVRWNEANNGWYLLPIATPQVKADPNLSPNSAKPLLKEMAGRMKRLCNFFESELSV
jgi:hypothetical protein